MQNIQKSFQELDVKISRLREIERESNIVPSIPPTMVLPEKETFEKFYDDIQLYKQPLKAVLKGGLIGVEHVSKSIVLSPRGIVELLSDKFQCPVLLDSDQEIKNPPEFVKNIDAILTNMMKEIELKWSKILEYKDPRVKQMCWEYHKNMSLPLAIRLAYHEWEKSIITSFIEADIAKKMEAKDAEVRQIQKDYSDKFEKLKISSRTEIDKFRKEADKIRQTIRDLDGAYQPVVRENESLKEEVFELHEKIKNAENKVIEIDSKYIKAKSDFDDVKQKLKKFEAGDVEWVKESGGKKDVYYNKISGIVYKYPENFSDYELEKRDGENLVYKDTHGNVFIVPESLASFRRKTIESAKTPTTSEKKDKKCSEENLTKNDIRVLTLIKEHGKLSKGELSKMSGIQRGNIDPHINRLLAFECIERIEDENEHKIKTEKFVVKGHAS